MLARKDRWGVVTASIPGIAKAAQLTVQETESALKVLESPDKYSSSQEHQGRRIKAIPGGWEVLNHFKYRDMISDESRKEYNRVRQAEYRKRKKEVKQEAKREGAQQAIREGFQGSELRETAPPYQSNTVPQPSVQTFNVPYTPP